MKRFLLFFILTFTPGILFAQQPAQEALLDEDQCLAEKVSREMTSRYDSFIRRQMNDTITLIADLYTKFFDVSLMRDMDDEQFASRYYFRDGFNPADLGFELYSYPGYLNQMLLKTVCETGSDVLAMLCRYYWGESPVSCVLTALFRSGGIEFDYSSEAQRFVVINMFYNTEDYPGAEDTALNVLNEAARERVYTVVNAYDDFIRRQTGDTITPVGELYQRFFDPAVLRNLQGTPGEMARFIPIEGYDQAANIINAYTGYAYFPIGTDISLVMLELARTTGKDQFAYLLNNYQAGGGIPPSFMITDITNGVVTLDYNSVAQRYILASSVFIEYYTSMRELGNLLGFDEPIYNIFSLLRAYDNFIREKNEGKMFTQSGVVHYPDFFSPGKMKKYKDINSLYATYVPGGWGDERLACSINDPKTGRSNIMGEQVSRVWIK